MPLNGLLAGNSGIGSGRVLATLLNGQYRVLYNGQPTLATSQCGILPVGSLVTLARTAAGLVIVSSGNVSATASVEVTING